jgi:Mn2+/Fe2+ NRAMP family transporter
VTGRSEAQPGPRRLSLETLRAIGPGLVSGASDTDPTTVGAIVVIGATTVFGLAWLALLIAPALIVVQLVATRLGVLSGGDLQTVARQRFGPLVRLTLLVSIVAVTVLTLAADLQAGASAIGLLTGAPSGWLVAPLAAAIVALLCVGSYPSVLRVLKYLALALLAYVASTLVANVDWGRVGYHSVVPTLHWNHDYLAGALALLGTTITSYVYVWQTIELAEERPGRAWLRAKETDATVGIIFAVVIIWFILVAAGATLGVHHQHVQTADEAARSLRPLAGSWASALFGLGLLASALVAVPVLMSTAAYVTGAQFGWRCGLSEPIRRAPRFYAALVVAALAALVITVSHAGAIQLLFSASIAGGIGTPIGLVCLVVAASDGRVMHGEPIGRGLRAAAWLVTALITVMSLLYLADSLLR